jgi:hypothetical protein
MTLNWFKNVDNVSYSNIDDFADNFAKESGISNLRQEIEEFKENPIKEGKTLLGKKRTSLKLLIPNDYFNADIPMGDSVWIYVGEHYPAYCLYWNETK